MTIPSLEGNISTKLSSINNRGPFGRGDKGEGVKGEESVEDPALSSIVLGKS